VNNESRSQRGSERREAKGGRRNRMVIARGVDLIVAVGREIRITHLTDYKGRVEDVETDFEKGRITGPYKVRILPSLSFDIKLYFKIEMFFL
jgi:hypothetical protein